MSSTGGEARSSDAQVAVDGGVTVVIGVGNEWRGDDGAGLAVARRLSGRLRAGVRVLEREGEPTALLDAWSGTDEAIVVDAVDSGAAPGTIHRLDARREPLPAELFRGSTHALGLAGAVELARALRRMPARLLVYGIEGESFAAGCGLSPEVERAVDEVAAELSERLAQPAPPPPGRSARGTASS
jgi:hydrogenase maturation protease